MTGLVVDNFAGGGGASAGIEMAIGRSVDIAINHDPDAIAMHRVNHPATQHYCEDVWQVDPVAACAGVPVALAWFSPDCTHFSRAKGGKPVDKNIRGLAWVTVKWAALVRPAVIMLENVPEIRTWGPLGADGKPIKARAGETFDGFVKALTTGIPQTHPAFAEMCDALGIAQDSELAQKISRGLGYDLDYKVLKSCDYGAPTTRTRFYMIARSDGRPIVWAEPTYAPRDSADVKAGRKLPYHTAAECIDWSIPCQSIFGRKKPLAENTMRRIARGIQKFVVENPEPFIVPIGYGERDGQAPRVNSIDRPLGTVVTGGKHYLVTPTITAIGQTGSQTSRTRPADEPLSTVVSKAEHILVAPTLIQYHGETGKDEVRGQELGKPIMTVDTSPRYALSAAYIMTMRNHMDGQPVDEPLTTISCSGAHHAEVQAFLVKYFSNGVAKPVDEPLDTVTTRDRFALVTIHGEQYIITDIKMRMLQPRELFNAQGFPRNYVIDHDADGHPYGKSKQVARCGNAVTPPVPAALVRANLPEMCKGASA